MTAKERMILAILGQNHLTAEPSDIQADYTAWREELMCSDAEAIQKVINEQIAEHLAPELRE